MKGYTIMYIPEGDKMKFIWKHIGWFLFASPFILWAWFCLYVVYTTDVTLHTMWTFTWVCVVILVPVLSGVSWIGKVNAADKRRRKDYWIK